MRASPRLRAKQGEGEGELCNGEGGSCGGEPKGRGAGLGAMLEDVESDFQRGMARGARMRRKHEQAKVVGRRRSARVGVLQKWGAPEYWPGCDRVTIRPLQKARQV